MEFLNICNIMIIVEIGKNENLERALKTLKSKVIKTKQQKIICEALS